MADTLESLTTIFEKIIQINEFAAGATFGMLSATILFWLASRERNKRTEIELERERDLRKQLNLKDQRLDELHRELGKARRSRK
jgi:hypothetical protein